MNDDSVTQPPPTAWQSHAWIARQLELQPGTPLVQHICANCGRNFVEEIATGERYAVQKIELKKGDWPIGPTRTH